MTGCCRGRAARGRRARRRKRRAPTPRARRAARACASCISCSTTLAAAPRSASRSARRRGSARRQAARCRTRCRSRSRAPEQRARRGVGSGEALRPRAPASVPHVRAPRACACLRRRAMPRTSQYSILSIDLDRPADSKLDFPASSMHNVEIARVRGSLFRPPSLGES